jgi:glucan phosphoethanolaminetransferase (alkaline phosphatase superfamily)
MPKPVIICAAKFGLISLAILFGLQGFFERLSHFGLSPGLALYAGQFLLFVFLIFTAGWIQNRVIRILFAVLLALGSLPTLIYEHSGSGPLGYFEFTTIIDARSALPDALTMYVGGFLIGFVGALLLAVGLMIKPPAAPRVPQFAAILGPVSGLALLFGTLMWRQGDGAAGLPPSWVGLGYASLYAYDLAQGAVGPREPVALVPVKNMVDRDIVLIIDESVAGQYLDINGPTGVRSGLMTPPLGAEVHNFGLAASISNCSMGSNVGLRFGATRTDYRRMIGTMPSIWSYAKKAGLRTAYLYAQRGGENENYMTNLEREDIDRSFLFDHLAAIDRDQAVAQTLAELINDDQHDFILVNKMGAHFPVHASYPEKFARYAPALPRNAFWTVEGDSDESRASLLGQKADWRRYRNAYRNTITWTVGAFFDRLFAGADMGKALVIYTSDHGQTFHDNGSPGLSTHCRQNPDIEEGVVPLVVIDSLRKPMRTWQDAVKTGKNASSHFRIFPTLLSLMGYSDDAVRGMYGPALSSDIRDPMTFASGFQIRSAHPAKWTMMDIGKVVRPPAADYAAMPTRVGAKPMQ